MPFHRILVPVDLGDDNRRAVDLGAELACLHPDGTLLLLHVIETIEDEPADEIGDFYTELEGRARTNMEALAEGVARKPSTIERTVAYGKRLQEILAAATASSADLVVMRSHRFEPGVAGGGIGTLSHEIAVLARVPVLLVK